MQAIEDGQAAHETGWKMPTTPAGEVHRDSLVDALCGPRATRLTLVRAPAGFGKTTLMLQCRAQLAASARVVWLRFDPSDNNPSRFASLLEDALCRALKSQASAFDDAQRSGPGRQATLARTAHAMHASARPFALFLDNFHHITSAPLLNWLSDLLELVPAKGRVLIGTRYLPGLRLARFRARAELTEIDAARLRFSQEETDRFLHLGENHDLEPASSARLHEKTQGWPAALSLAQASLSRSPDARLFVGTYSGAEEAISRYLRECVLAGQGPEVLDFMQRTSILETLDPALCQELVPHSDAPRILDALENAGLAIASDAGLAFHALLQELLRAHLQRYDAEAYIQLHLLASRHHQTHGRHGAAIHHALQAGALQRALPLLATHGMQLLSEGRMATVSCWFDAIPYELLAGSEELLLIWCWAACNARGPSAASAMLETSGLQGSADPRVASQVLALRTCILTMQEQHDDAYRMGNACLARFPPGDVFVRGALLNALAAASLALGRPDEARRLADATLATGDGSSFPEIAAHALTAHIDWQQGHPLQAAARLQALRDVARPRLDVWVALPLANALYEFNQIDEAARILHAQLPAVRTMRVPALLLSAYRALARIAFWRGEAGEAFRYLAEYELLSQAAGLRNALVAARTERAFLFLLDGRIEQAREELDRAAAGTRDVEILGHCRLRLQVLAGDTAQAAAQLERAASRAEIASRRRCSLRLRLLHAGARMRLGEASLAMAQAESVLREAHAEGFVRLVLDEAIIAAPAIHALHARLAERSDGMDTSFRIYLEKMSRASQAWKTGPCEPDPHAFPAQPLSRKELVVLRLLAEGHSNTAMAQKLIVSDSTVRSHLRKIYSKLDVHSRTQAILHSRQKGLLA